MEPTEKKHKLNEKARHKHSIFLFIWNIQKRHICKSKIDEGLRAQGAGEWLLKGIGDCYGINENGLQLDRQDVDYTQNKWTVHF